MPTPLKALILEDQKTDAELLLYELEKAGFAPEAEVVADRASYLARLDPALDVVLADYVLPQFDALAALQLLKARGLDIPFIIVTGAIGEETAAECIKQGAADYLLKDRLTRLGPAVRRAINERGLREEMRQAVAALRESEARYRTLVESVDDAIHVEDAEGRYVLVNSELARRVGRPREEIIGRTAREIYPPAVGDQIWADDRRTLDSGLVVDTEREIPTPAGPRVFHSRNIPLRGSDGAIVGLVAVSRDVTQRKRAEEERERLLVREQALARVGQVLVSEVELSRVASVALEEGLRVFGVEAGAIWLATPARRELSLVGHRGLSATTVAALSDVSYDAPLVSAQAARTEQPRFVPDIWAEGVPELSRVHAAREAIQAMAALPLRGRGQLIGVATYFSRTPRQFAAADRSLLSTITDLFAVALENARLHHDLRQREHQVSLLLRATIDAQEEERQRVCLEVHDGVAQALAPASQHLQALAAHPELPAGLKPRVATVAGLVSEALREARAVIATLRPATLDSLGLVGTLRRELAELAERTGLRIELDAADAHYPDAVETTLYRIVREAVQNAAKHARASAVVVRFAPGPASLTVTIEDDGQGFGLVRLERQERPVGVGLLSMRKRAELLGGSLTITTAPGRGTRICVEIPLARAGDERPGSTDAWEARRWAPGDPVAVLIVDDHALTRQGLRAVLETEPSVLVVGEAADGFDALRQVAELRPHVVLMDFRMPRLDGLEATRQIKAKHPEVAVIILTSYEDEDLVVRAIQAGAAGYLLKDSSRELLTSTISAAISGGTLVKSDLLGRALASLAPATASDESALPELPALTQREREVLELIAEGLSNREIATRLTIAETTVKKYVQGVIGKLGVSDRTQAAVLALRLGVVR